MSVILSTRRTIQSCQRHNPVILRVVRNGLLYNGHSARSEPLGERSRRIGERSQDCLLGVNSAGSKLGAPLQ